MNGPKLRAEHRARQEFERVLMEVKLDLSAGVLRRHLDMGVRCLELLVEQCGDNLITWDNRSKLAEIKRRIVARNEEQRQLRLVRNTESN